MPFYNLVFQILGNWYLFVHTILPFEFLILDNKDLFVHTILSLVFQIHNNGGLFILYHATIGVLYTGQW